MDPVAPLFPGLELTPMLPPLEPPLVPDPLPLFDPPLDSDPPLSWRGTVCEILWLKSTVVLESLSAASMLRPELVRIEVGPDVAGHTVDPEGTHEVGGRMISFWNPKCTLVAALRRMSLVLS